MKKSDIKRAFQQAKNTNQRVTVNGWSFVVGYVEGRMSIAHYYELIRPDGMRHGLGRGIDSATNFAYDIIAKHVEPKVR
jgi:hypothetical protein